MEILVAVDCINFFKLATEYNFGGRYWSRVRVRISLDEL